MPRYRTTLMPLALFLLGPVAADELPVIGPYLQDLRPESVLVRWQTARVCRGDVEVVRAVTPDGRSEPARRLAERVAGRLHEVRIDGLEAGAAYSYRIFWDGKRSPVYPFRAGPPPETRRFRLAAYGDSRSHPEVHEKIVAGIVAAAPDIVIHTGDLVDDGRKERLWKPQFFDPVFPLARSTPVITSLGNHEKNADHYFRYFHYPGNEAWFSYRWANVHFIVLASQLALDAASEQTSWLEEELRGPDAEWRVVFFHHPMFSCHPSRPVHENRWAWQDLFERHGVDLVLTGHDHFYHRTHPIGRAWGPTGRGVVHVTTAGGGASLHPIAEREYTSVAKSVHHFVVLDFDGPTVTGRAIDVDGAVIDSFTVDQRGESPPLFSYELLLWERELGRTLADRAPRALPTTGERVREAIELPLLLETPVDLEYRWLAEPGFWDGASGRLRVEPGAAFSVAVEGAGAPERLFPLPVLELVVAGGLPSGRRLVNPRLRLAPLRIDPDREATAPAVERIVVDGRLDEAGWRGARELGAFTRDSGTAVSAGETVFLGHDRRGLVLGIRARSPLERLVRLRLGSFVRDDEDVIESDESLIVALSSPEDDVSRLFAANTYGAAYDALGGDEAWSPEWEFRATATPDGWEGEARIPWRALGLDGPPTRPWRFNVLRRDRAAGALGEWTPTYSPDGMERRHDGRLVFAPGR